MFSPPRSASNSSYLPVPTFNKEDIQFVHNTEIEGKNFTFYFWRKKENTNLCVAYDDFLTHQINDFG